MKTFYSLTFLWFACVCSGQQQTSTASCCSSERGCSGSSYCTACSNCSGCRHCAKEGGSCGVCSSGSTKSYSTSKPKKKNSSTKPSAKKSNIQSSDSKPTATYKNGDYLYVVVDQLNIRKQSNSSSAILEKVNRNSKLKFIEAEGSWYKVEVTATQTIGYVYFKYVK